MVRHTKTTLLTGSTGFIGQYLLRDLLRRGQRVVVLCRGSTMNGQLRLVQIMPPLGIAVEPHLESGQLIVASGCLPNQLPEAFWGRTDQVIHSAACLQVENDGKGEPFVTNFLGAQALAHWADRHQIADFHFVSTAYTCGRDAKIADEQFHHPRPRFETDYELSKWQAEEFLLDWTNKTGRRLTIYRPSLVIGDSQTGYSTQFGGFYLLARMVEVLERFFREEEGPLYLPLRIPALPHEEQNLVPVDYVSAALVEIVCRPELHGRIYHLTNPYPPTNDQLKNWLERYYNVWGGHFVQQVDPCTSESLAESMFLKMDPVVFEQMRYTPRFDCQNTLRALSGTSVRVPALNDEAVFRLLDFARSCQWGRQVQAAAS